MKNILISREQTKLPVLAKRKANPEKIIDPVTVSKQYLEYLEKGTHIALRAGLYKAKVFNAHGKVVALQG